MTFRQKQKIMPNLYERLPPKQLIPNISDAQIQPKLHTPTSLTAITGYSAHLKLQDEIQLKCTNLRNRLAPNCAPRVDSTPNETILSRKTPSQIIPLLKRDIHSRFPRKQILLPPPEQEQNNQKFNDLALMEIEKNEEEPKPLPVSELEPMDVVEQADLNVRLKPRQVAMELDKSERRCYACGSILS